ncbi:MAG: SxtJ family membrane protein [Smithella sp.]
MVEDKIKKLDKRGLREFGLTTGGAVAVLFGLFFPWVLERPIPYWPWVIAVVLILWGLMAPLTLQPVYRGWMKFSLLISKVTTPVIMGIVFFLVVTPMGLLRRLAGKDSMARRFEPSATYRIPSHKAPIKNMEKPF